MASFLSRTNTREDGLRCAREQRVRLPLEVLAVVRACVGPDCVVGCRYLAYECIDGGSPVDEAMFWVSNSHARQWISFQRPAEASLMTLR